MTIIKAAASFTDLQNWLKDWFIKNPNAVQLDGSFIEKKNPRICVTMELAGVGCLTGKVSFNGDTKVCALKEIVNSSLNDFVIVPPQNGKKNWRFHFGKTLNYSNVANSDGLYAFFKES